MLEKRAIFVTGVTGTLGKEFLRELIETRTEHIYVLVRRKGRHSHWDRVRKTLAAQGLDINLGTRVQVFEGDVTLPDFGLQPYEREELRKNVVEFFHIAALTALNGSEEDCAKINTGGTVESLKMAWFLRKSGRLERFFYFSTAYVSGSLQTYHAKEDELPAKPAHANFYESSKFLAETKVREAMAEGLPVTIFRPSIVVGDSRTGEVSEFNVIYPFIKLFVHGILSVLPTKLENSFNIVPIDFVIKASSIISRQKDSVGKAYHLTSPEPPTIGMLLKLKEEAEYANVPEVSIVPPEDFKKEGLDPMAQNVFQMLEPYLGYLNGNLTFDASNTEKALKGTGLVFPETGYEFLKTLMNYAVSSGYLVLR